MTSLRSDRTTIARCLHEPRPAPSVPPTSCLSLLCCIGRGYASTIGSWSSGVGAGVLHGF